MGVGHPTSGHRVLLVEDEMMVALLLEGELTALGHEVIGPVGRVQQALAIAQHDSLDVALLDVNVNGAEVYPVADALAARGIPYIFVTGYGNRGLRAQYRDRPTLQKPFEVEDLLEAIEEACRGARN
jgi:CheY-like chemotaxis protein